MSDALKTKWLTAVVALLVLANVVTLSIFWIEKTKRHDQAGPPRKEPAFEFLIKELVFDSSQILAYEKLKIKHQQGMPPLNDAIKEAKHRFFSLIAKSDASTAEIDAAMNAQLMAQKNIDLSLFNHFREVRQLCTPAQQEKFDGLIEQIIRMIGQRRPGGPGKSEHREPPPHGKDEMLPPPPKQDAPPE